MAENDSELLNTVYREVADELGMDTAMKIYRLFKGQQICFPVRFFNPSQIQQIIIREYDGTNIRTLAIKYNYSEKTVRRIIKNSAEQYADDICYNKKGEIINDSIKQLS